MEPRRIGIVQNSLTVHPSGVSQHLDLGDANQSGQGKVPSSLWGNLQGRQNTLFLHILTLGHGVHIIT